MTGFMPEIKCAFRADGMQHEANMTIAARTLDPYNVRFEVIDPAKADALIRAHEAYVLSLPEDERAKAQRKLRPSVVKAYSEIMTRGNWEVTHQGICISPSTGRIIDGLHRLHAIRSTGLSQILMVTRFDADFLSIDRGATRTVSDCIGIDKRVAEILSRVARLVTSSATATKDNKLIESLIDTDVGACARTLISLCGSARKTISSGPVRVAAVANMVRLPKARIAVANQYKNLVTLQYEMMDNPVLLFEKQCARGKVRSFDDYSLMVRAYLALRPEGWNSKLVRVYDSQTDKTISEIRAVFTNSLLSDGVDICRKN